MAILTAEEVRLTAIPGLGTATSEDSKIETLIARAAVVLAEYLGFPPVSAGGEATLEQATYTEYYDGPGGTELALGFRPVGTITSIHDDPDRGYSATYLVASTDYEVDGRQGIVYLDTTATHGAWSRGARRAIKVVFQAGWSTVPKPVKDIAISMVARSWKRRTVAGATNIAKGGTNISLRDSAELRLTDEDKAVLAPYRQPRAVGP